jgi:hypothetical protein
VIYDQRAHKKNAAQIAGMKKRTICRAAMHTVLTVNLRPQILNKSSRLDPSRSITRTLMLCKPSHPKKYVRGIPAGIWVQRIGYEVNATLWRKEQEWEYHNHPICDTSDTRCEVEAHLSFSAPIELSKCQNRVNGRAAAATKERRPQT